MRKIATVAAVLAAVAACVSLGVLLSSNTADAEGDPFPMIGAVNNMHALTSADTVKAGADPRIARLSSDVAPTSPTTVHEIGNGVLAWQRGSGRVCYLTQEGAGGCFSRFAEPVNMTAIYNNGVSTVVGIVPDNVASVEVTTVQGDRIATVIEGNTFSARLPSNRSADDISGQNVVMKNGASFFSDSRG